MRFNRIVLVGVALLVSAGCSSGDTTESGAIGDDEINRYQLEFTGGLELDHTGGLICEVQEGNLDFGFSIDVSTGEYEYLATFGDFDPSQTTFDGTLTLGGSSGAVYAGAVTITFEYGPAPADYPGVVRAAGTMSGSLEGTGSPVAVAGTYACFLMDSEVGS